MKTRVARRNQITIPEEIRKKASISVGDILKISYKRGKVQVEKTDENWDKVMKETKGAWSKHPVFKEKKLLKNKRSSNRILPDFIIGAHAELYSDALVTWNPSDFDLNKVVKTPVEIMK